MPVCVSGERVAGLRQRTEAGLEKDIVFVGVMSKIEIWSKEHWDENDDFENVDEIAEHMSELGLSY